MRKFIPQTTSFCFIILLFFAAKGVCLAKPLALITVDVETIERNGEDLSLCDQWDQQYKGTQYGFSAILDILEKHNMRGVFFYNAYEYDKTKNNKMIQIARTIEKRGHDIELHTHPQWSYNPAKVFMHQYSLEEQTEIIRHGKDLLENWTGKKIIAHRAGAYGADMNTLIALRKNGIYFDSSYFFNHKWCELNRLNPLIKKNFFTTVESIIEVPINVFNVAEIPPVLHNVSPVNYIAKYDINDWVSEEALVKATDAAIEENFDAITYFLHSFTFIQTSPSGKLSPKFDLLTKFDNILNHVEQKQIKVITFEDLNYLQQNGKIPLLNTTDSLPAVKIEIDPLRYIAKRLKLKSKDILTFIFILFVFTIFSLVYFSLTKKKQV